MLGGYSLLYLDEDTYNQYKNALATDPRYPLWSYPSTDAATGAVADPYNPAINGRKVRYPQNHGFDMNELMHGKCVYQKVAAPLPSEANLRFFNIRGVQFEGGRVAYKTINSQKWGWIDPDFDPDAPEPVNPITDVTVCPGDGIIPAWSARLVTTPPDNVRTLTGDLDHQDLMNAPVTQNELSNILGLEQATATVRGKRILGKVQIAGPTDVLDFMNGLNDALSEAERLGSPRGQAIRRHTRRYSLVQLRALMSRTYIDALKTPSQKLGAAPTLRVTPPKEDGDLKGPDTNIGGEQTIDVWDASASFDPFRSCSGSDRYEAA
jgi:hypothetical protein